MKSLIAEYFTELQIAQIKVHRALTLKRACKKALEYVDTINTRDELQVRKVRVFYYQRRKLVSATLMEGTCD